MSLPHEANAKSHANHWITCVLVSLALMPIAARRCLDFFVAAVTVVDVRIDLCMVTDRLLLTVNNRFMPNNNDSYGTGCEGPICKRQLVPGSTSITELSQVAL